MGKALFRPGRRAIILLLCGALIAGYLATARSAEAWKPPTHLFGTEGALQDAADDGQVTIPSVDGQAPVTVPANPTIVDALRAHPEAYRAGTLGPDAYPDIIFGQASIHPDTCSKNGTDPPVVPCDKPDKSQTFQWFTYLWEQAWNPAIPEDQRLKNIAFALGYMGGHGAGDIWGHTWVNSYAEGVFPDFTDVAHADIAVRHLVVEGYADKHRPGAGNEQTYDIGAPLGFVGDQLILSDFAKAHGSHPLYDFFFGLQDSLRDTDESMDDDAASQDFIGECPFCVPDPTDAPLNLVELGFLLLADEYVEAWIDDITDGLRAWPEVSEAIAREIFTGKDPETGPIKDELKKWFLLHFLSMMGLPDFVGTGIYLVDEIIGFVLGLVQDALSAIFDALEQVPILGDIIQAIEQLYDDAKAFVEQKINELLDSICNYFVGGVIDSVNLSPTVKAVLDRDQDGTISCDEIVNILHQPEVYLLDTRLFPAGTRARIDADMHLHDGVDADSSAAAGTTIILNGADDDLNGYFRDYDGELFAPLRDTTLLAKLAMLDQSGLNAYFKAKAGGNVAALGNLYGPHAPVNAGIGWTVPNNVMLGSPNPGWATSIDAEYQFRTNSPNDGRQYGTGDMAMWEDCVSRDRVFRNLFAQPVTGIDAFTDAGDPPSPISDDVAPVSTLTLSGPNVVNDGKTYVSGKTQLQITSTDNYWAKADLRVKVRTYPAGTAAPPYGPAVPADPAPFTLTGDDGAKVVNYFAIDGKGVCKAEGEHSDVFSLDNTPPTITVISPVPPKSDYLSDAILPLNFTATDTGSGVDPATLRHFADGVEQFPIPTTIDLFDYPAFEFPGTPVTISHIYKAQAADRLGNLGVAEVPWRTVVTHQSLRNNLDKAFFQRGCITGSGIYTSLKQELQVAKDADARGNDGASDLQLEAFKEDIRSQIGKAVTPYCANILTRNATYLIQA